MTTTYSPWAVFEGLKTLQDYKPSDLDAFAERLFDHCDEEKFLVDYCFIQDCINILEAIKTAVRPTVQQIVLNQPKAFTIAGYKFTYRAQSQYDYSFCPMWVQANESVKFNMEHQKLIEEICKRGGSLGGTIIEKVPVKITDNFSLSKVTDNQKIKWQE